MTSKELTVWYWLIGVVLMIVFARSPWGGYSLGAALVLTAIFDRSPDA